MKAVYENGVFRPLEPVDGVEDREQVDLVISRPHEWGILLPARIIGEQAEEVLRSIPGSLSRHEAREMMNAIEEEFEQIEDGEPFSA